MITFCLIIFYYSLGDKDNSYKDFLDCKNNDEEEDGDDSKDNDDENNDNDSIKEGDNDEI
jgi:hypothetical protein